LIWDSISQVSISLENILKMELSYDNYSYFFVVMFFNAIIR